MKEYYGCWPTMITPFTEEGKVDYVAIRNIVDWYIANGADGIFAVCQSSEMFFLTEQEKLDIAKAVLDANAGRIKVIASGHTADDLSAQVEQLGKMAETGVDAVVLVSNRIARQDESEEVFRKNADYIFNQLPDVTFGLYECPYPYLRLISLDFLSYCANTGKLVFIKDVCCSQEILKKRIAVTRGTNLSLFNANTSTLLQFFRDGGDGYNGVMANFHIDLYKWMYENFEKKPELAEKVNDFLTVAGVCEARAYPVSAKYHFNEIGISMSTYTRSKDRTVLNENAMHEIDALIRMENSLRAELKK